jgi:hypothetical protein
MSREGFNIRIVAQTELADEHAIFLAELIRIW